MDIKDRLFASLLFTNCSSAFITKKEQCPVLHDVVGASKKGNDPTHVAAVCAKLKRY
jgi:hypothetical protein